MFRHCYWLISCCIQSTYRTVGESIPFHSLVKLCACTSSEGFSEVLKYSYSCCDTPVRNSAHWTFAFSILNVRKLLNSLCLSSGCHSYSSVSREGFESSRPVAPWPLFSVVWKRWQPEYRGSVRRGGGGAVLKCIVTMSWLLHGFTMHTTHWKNCRGIFGGWGGSGQREKLAIYGCIGIERNHKSNSTSLLCVSPRPDACKVKVKFKATLRLTVGQYVLVSSPLWDLWLDIIYCLKVAVKSVWGALSDERSGLSFVGISL
jgi:hypothetical protein